MKKDLAIVVPCYNEADRLPFSQFENFLSLQSKVSIFFVNDGSKDKTEKVLTGSGFLMSSSRWRRLCWIVPFQGLA